MPGRWSAVHSNNGGKYAHGQGQFRHCDFSVRFTVDLIASMQQKGKHEMKIIFAGVCIGNINLDTLSRNGDST